MRKFKITVNGNEYEVTVEELTEESQNEEKEEKKPPLKDEKHK